MRPGTAKRQLKRLLWNFPKPEHATHLGVRLPIRHPAITPPILEDIYFGSYESGEAELVSATIDADDIVMEVGAGIGFLSVLTSRIVGGDHVFAYEANPRLMEIIRDVHDLNQVRPTVRNVLLGEGDSERTFWVTPDFWASSLIQGHEDATPVQVTQIDLNDEIQRVKPSFLVLDIEGGEYEFLRHARLDPVRKIVMEVHPQVLGHAKVTEILGWLFAAGFVLHLGHSRKHVVYLFKDAA